MKLANTLASGTLNLGAPAATVGLASSVLRIDINIPLSVSLAGSSLRRAAAKAVRWFALFPRRGRTQLMWPRVMGP